MKKLLIIFFLFLIALPSIMYTPKIDAKTIADLRRELQEIERRKNENNNKINMTQSEINSIEDEISRNYQDIDRIMINLMRI